MKLQGLTAGILEAFLDGLKDWTPSSLDSKHCGDHGSRMLVYLKWTPHPIVVTRKDNNKDYIRVLLDSYYTTIIGWGVLLKYVKVQVSRAKSTRVGKYLQNTFGGRSLSVYHG